MKPAPTLSTDPERLQALRELLILDTPPEERFNRVTAFAAAEFDVPICAISLVDENRQWFKARVGLDVCETPRDVSFCGHALEQSDVLLIEDAHKDERFHDNPLVTGEPGIRFYAGAPLVLPNGFVAGTLCVIDTKPRQVNAIDLAILGSLRELVVAELLGQSLPDDAVPSASAEPRPNGF